MRGRLDVRPQQVGKTSRTYVATHLLPHMHSTHLLPRPPRQLRLLPRRRRRAARRDAARAAGHARPARRLRHRRQERRAPRGGRRPRAGRGRAACRGWHPRHLRLSGPAERRRDRQPRQEEVDTVGYFSSLVLRDFGALPLQSSSAGITPPMCSVASSARAASRLSPCEAS